MKVPVLPVRSLPDVTHDFERLQEVITILEAKFSKLSYTAPVFEHAWVNFAEGYLSAGYAKDSFGFVYLTGLIKSGEMNKSAFTLPVGFRPSAKIQAAGYSGGLYGGILIEASGAVVPNVGANGSQTLLIPPFLAEG